MTFINNVTQNCGSRRPDMRKGSAFPVAVEEIFGGSAARIEAQPQRRLKVSDGKAKAFPHISGQSRKTSLA
jgi:hypothetical protein